MQLAFPLSFVVWYFKKRAVLLRKREPLLPLTFDTRMDKWMMIYESDLSDEYKQFLEMKDLLNF